MFKKLWEFINARKVLIIIILAMIIVLYWNNGSDDRANLGNPQWDMPKDETGSKTWRNRSTGCFCKMNVSLNYHIRITYTGLKQEVPKGLGTELTVIPRSVFWIVADAGSDNFPHIINTIRSYTATRRNYTCATFEWTLYYSP